MTVPYTIVLECTSTGFVWDTQLGSCVCAVDYYQSSADPLQCTACPSGSTTNGDTNSNTCG